MSALGTCTQVIQSKTLLTLLTTSAVYYVSDTTCSNIINAVAAPLEYMVGTCYTQTCKLTNQLRAKLESGSIRAIFKVDTNGLDVSSHKTYGVEKERFTSVVLGKLSSLENTNKGSGEVSKVRASLLSKLFSHPLI